MLEAATRQGVALPYSCHNGACGACKEQSHRWRGQPPRLPAACADEAERAQGMALLCCAETQGDLTVEVREVKPAATSR